MADLYRRAKIPLQSQIHPLDMRVWRLRSDCSLSWHPWHAGDDIGAKKHSRSFCFSLLSDKSAPLSFTWILQKPDQLRPKPENHPDCYCRCKPLCLNYPGHSESSSICSSWIVVNNNNNNNNKIICKDLKQTGYGTAYFQLGDLSRNNNRPTNKTRGLDFLCTIVGALTIGPSSLSRIVHGAQLAKRWVSEPPAQ